MRNINGKNKDVFTVAAAPSAAKTGSLARGLAKCALFAVLMVAASFVRIPVPYVPITFQTVVAVLAGILLGAKAGAASMLFYIFMGLIGLPVFSGGGGVVYVLQLTFGYIVGFAAAAFAAGLVRGRGVLCFRRAVWAALAGVAANYLIGIPYFMCIWHFYMNLDGLWTAVLVNNFLFFPKDVLLCFAAACLAVRMQTALRRR